MRIFVTYFFLMSLAFSNVANAFCFQAAGKAYDVNPVVLMAIAQAESNYDPAAINYNSNGSYDFGLMQINSDWYFILGEQVWLRLGEPCVNVYVAAWILKDNLLRLGNLEDALASYNAGSKFTKGKPYAKKVIKIIRRLCRKQQKGTLHAACQDPQIRALR